MADKNAEDVVAALREAIRLDPDNAKFHYKLGLALQKKVDVEGAIGAFREVVRLSA